MPVTDTHAHILTEDLPGQLREAGLSSEPTLVPAEGNLFLLEFAGGRRHGPIPQGLVDLDQRISDMDAQSVEVQILSAVPMLFAHEEPVEIGSEVSRLTNDTMLDVAERHPERFQVFVSLPMQDSDAAVAELERVAVRPHVRGVEIATHVAGSNFDDRRLDPIWEALEHYDMPAQLHPAPPITTIDNRLGSYHLTNLIGNPLESTIAVAALTFGGVFERHPDLRIGLVHGGGYWPYQTGRWDHGFEWRREAKVNIDVPPSAFYGQIFSDSLTHDRASLRFLGERIGWDHVMVGSDYPFDMAERDPVNEVRAAELDVDALRAVLEENVDRFLRPCIERA